MNIASVLKKPIITEKSMSGIAKNIVSFKVDAHATKGQVKQSVKETYGVNVVKVRTVNIAGKTRRVGKMRYILTKPKWKKAVVTLKQGEKIDVFETKT